MAIYKNNRIVIDLTELVECRALELSMGKSSSEYEVEQIASLHYSIHLTWDTLFFMVDTAILDFKSA